MAARISPILIVVVGLVLMSLTGCDKTVEPVAAPEAPAATSTPDPTAPAPGTQAAEAIGADSSSDAPVIPPEKQRH